MTTVRIRPAGPGDASWAAGVMSSSEPWKTLGRDFSACLRSCENPLDALHIACCGIERCGLALTRERGVAGAPYLVSIAVAEPYRGRGVGDQVLAWVEDQFRGRYRHLFLCVSAFNPRAHAFYVRHGFRDVGLLDDFIVPGLDETLMVKRL